MLFTVEAPRGAVSRTTIRLSDPKFNVTISDGTFRFNDPVRGGPRK